MAPSEPQPPPEGPRDAPPFAHPLRDEDAVARQASLALAPAPLRADEPELAPAPAPHPLVMNPPDAHAPVEIDEV